MTSCNTAESLSCQSLSATSGTPAMHPCNAPQRVPRATSLLMSLAAMRQASLPLPWQAATACWLPQDVQTYVAGIFWRCDDGRHGSKALMCHNVCVVGAIHTHCDVAVCQQCGQHLPILKISQLLHRRPAHITTIVHHYSTPKQHAYVSTVSS